MQISKDVGDSYPGYVNKKKISIIHLKATDRQEDRLPMIETGRYKRVAAVRFLPGLILLVLGVYGRLRLR